MKRASEEHIKPASEFGEPNQSVLLKKTPASIVVEGTTYDGAAEVRLDLLPRAGIHIYANIEGVLPIIGFDIFNKKNKCSFFIDGQNVPGFCIDGGDVKKQKMTLTWCPKEEPVIWGSENSTTITNLVFHIFNFKKIFGIRRSSETLCKTTHAIEHVDMEANGWVIELRSLATTSDCFKKLKDKGGYGLTHIGSIRKTDGSSFSVNEVSNILSALRFFLSFAKGIWCNPVCEVGFDNGGKRVWESWSSPREPWYSPSSWFDEQHCSQLVDLFPGFLAKWQDENWKEALQEVIYRYLNANYSSRSTAEIILTQAAIERLSFEYAVKHKKLIEAEGFKALRASDKFRILFSSLDIPIEIPNSLKEMKKLGGKFTWFDSPHALTEIRNSLVHPEHKQRGKFSDTYFEAWNLGLWYLELALLRICDYSGSYSNRLVVSKWVGQVEDVPWMY